MTPTWIDTLTRIATHPERTPAEDVVTVNHAIRDALAHVSRLQGDREAALVVIERLNRENSDLQQRARAAEARVTLLMRKAMLGEFVMRPEICHDCGKAHATCDCGRYERGC